LRVVRQGAISLERLRDVVPGVLDVDGNAPDAAEAVEPTVEPAAAPEPGSA
jgi:hypothetical protein